MFFIYSYLLVDQVVYLTVCDQSYPRKLAFSYLDELSKEFQRSYESQIASANRPYCFRGFGELAVAFAMSHDRLADDPCIALCRWMTDTFISKTTRLYQDPHTAQASAPQSNMDKLNTDLQDVTRIMTKNMEDLLWRGDSLDRESSDALSGAAATSSLTLSLGYEL